MKLKLKLDERNLSRQWLFWLAIIGPVALFFITGYPVWKGKTLGLNQQAYTTFLDISKLPLLLLGLCVPLVAIVVYMHRTIQTHKQITHAEEQIKNALKQIDITINKNRSDSYYAHSKYIEDAFKSLPEKYIGHSDNEKEPPIKIIRPHSLYKHIFTNSNINDGCSTEVSKHFLAKMQMHFLEISNALNHPDVNKPDIKEQVSALESIDTHIYLLSNLLCLNYNPNAKLFDVGINPYKNTTPFKNEEKLKDMLICLYELAVSISDIIDVKLGYLDFGYSGENPLLNYIFSRVHVLTQILPTSSVNTTKQKFKL